MIIKKKVPPREIEVLQMLVRRVQPKHPHFPILQEKLGREMAGYKGEKALDYPLSFLPADHLIIHDLRLNDGSHIFQNDAIILTKKWLLLIEAKYMAGKLHYDSTNNQLLQTIDDETQAYDNPITQVRRHKRQLEKWLSLHRLPPIPIHCIVANSHPHCVISCDDPEPNIVTRTYNLPEKISEIKTKHGATPLSKAQLQNLSSSLLNQHRPNSYDYITHYKISAKDLRYGVHCLECGQIPMTRKRGTWLCKKCHYSDKNAHLPSLKDYSLFFGSQITNDRLRKFLRLDSHATANRILHSLDAEQTGENRGRIYHLKFN